MLKGVKAQITLENNSNISWDDKGPSSLEKTKINELQKMVDALVNKIESFDKNAEIKEVQ